MKLIKTDYYNQHEVIIRVRLFRNDVDIIIETYTAEGYSLSIYDDKYKYKSLDDYIKKQGYIVKKLILLFRKTEDKLISVNTFILEGNTVTISTDNRRDLFTEIFEHLKKRKPFKLYHQWPKNPIFLLLIFTTVLVVLEMLPPELEEFKLAKENNDKYLIIFSWFGGYLLLSFLIRKYYLRISLEKENKTWITKYRSEIIVVLMVAIFTFILKII